MIKAKIYINKIAAIKQCSLKIDLPLFCIPLDLATCGYNQRQEQRTGQPPVKKKNKIRAITQILSGRVVNENIAEKR